MVSAAVWIQASRPQTLIASFSPVVLGTLYTYTQGRVDLLIFCFTLLATLGIQIGTNLVNDYFDYLKGTDTSLRKGPVRVTQAGLVSLSQMKRAIFVCFFLTSLCSSYLILKGGLPIALLSSVSILLAFAYTAGPFPLSYLGLGDLFVLLFFGPLATGGTYFLQTHTLSLTPFLIGIGPGMLSTAILTANNLRDIEEDTKGNKRTLCVRFGKQFGQREYKVMLLGGTLSSLLYSHFLPLLALIPAFFLLRSLKKEEELPALLPRTGAFLLLYTLLNSIEFVL